MIVVTRVFIIVLDVVSTEVNGYKVTIAFVTSELDNPGRQLLD